MAIYNKMRPRIFSEVKGQEKVVNIIRANLAGGHLPNAMLFIGTRGTGKTTIARIVARTVNCEKPTSDGEPCNECSSCKAILSGGSFDVIELDAASHNGVDDIRDIIERVSYKPVSHMKVVILDEVHMLSTGAFNALLKLLEEPPKDTLFILCTTEYQKIPATILSRCRKFQFETISEDIIAEKLRMITSVYGKEAETGALYLIAQAAKGSMRDAESIFESFIDTDGLITEKTVRELLGYSPEEIIYAIFEGIQKGEPMLSSAAIEEVTEKGGSLSNLIEECLKFLMDIISVRLGADISNKVSIDYLNKVNDFAFSFETNRLFEISNAFQKCYEKRNDNLSLALQLMLIGLSVEQSSITTLQENMRKLEQRVSELEQQSSRMEMVAKPIEAIDSLDGGASVPTVSETDSKEISNTASESDIPEELPTAEEIAMSEMALNSEEPSGSADELSSANLSELASFGFCVDASETSEHQPPVEENMETSPAVEESAPILTNISEAEFFDDFVRQFIG